MIKALTVLAVIGVSTVSAHSAHSEAGMHIDSNTLVNMLGSVVDTSQLPAYAICKLQSHSSQYNVTGYVKFAQTQAVGTQITGEIRGFDPNGTHAFHIHELGDLSDPSNGCLSLSSHYNPFNETHGGKESCSRHLGDLGNLKADENGVATFNFTDVKIALVGPYSIIGRSCVAHAQEDDLGLGGNAESLKTGNAGARITCGVVGWATKPAATTATQ